MSDPRTQDDDMPSAPLIRTRTQHLKLSLPQRVWTKNRKDLLTLLSGLSMLLLLPVVEFALTGSFDEISRLACLYQLRCGPAPERGPELAGKLAEGMNRLAPPPPPPAPVLTLERPELAGLIGSQRVASSLTPSEIPEELRRLARQPAALGAASRMGGMEGPRPGLGDAPRGYGANLPQAARDGNPAGTGAGRPGAPAGAAGAAERIQATTGAKPWKPMLQALQSAGTQFSQRLRQAFQGEPEEEKRRRSAGAGQGSGGFAGNRAPGSRGSESMSLKEAALAAMDASNRAAQQAENLDQIAAGFNTDFQGQWQNDPFLAPLHAAMSKAKTASSQAASMMKAYTSQLQAQSANLIQDAQVLSSYDGNGPPPTPSSMSAPAPPDISRQLARLEEAQGEIQGILQMLDQVPSGPPSRSRIQAPRGGFSTNFDGLEGPK